MIKALAEPDRLLGNEGGGMSETGRRGAQESRRRGAKRGEEEAGHSLWGKWRRHPDAAGAHAGDRVGPGPCGSETL